jgi:hypothetical protein
MFYLRNVEKEEPLMKGLKKYFLLFLTVSLVMASLYSTGWAQEGWAQDDPVGQGWSAVDLGVARVGGVAAGILGSALFVVTLPFTIPSGGVHDAAKMFVIKPFQFSFIREFPDDDI